ncbi:hypothetical protein EVAR_52925_1 [Eumeta japonica]|uniref:Reverse transcriptase domain-containing protein n=1 Tax=Eumeta variegata TaxID=151549 RepID=A0A4C1Y4G5_EUMVA|nr:hypothetical protein EVAR_52925_1 [Eumeta japonica]
MDEISVKCLLYADDQVILSWLACGLQEIVNKMNDSVKKRGMKVNVGKTKVMVLERNESTTGCDILIEESLSKSANTTHSVRMQCAENTVSTSSPNKVKRECNTGVALIEYLLCGSGFESGVIMLYRVLLGTAIRFDCAKLYTNLRPLYITGGRRRVGGWIDILSFL